MTSEISVFIPVFNGAPFIGRAIESVLNQSFNNLSLIIADNCSTDQTISVVERYMSDSRVTLIQREQNIGLFENFNSCLAAINTKYFMVLSHDDYFYLDSALMLAFEILESSPEVPVVYSDMIFVDKYGQSIIAKQFGYNGLVANSRVAKRSIVSGRNFFSIPVLSRTSLLNGLNYDESFPLSADVDFAIAFGENSDVYYINQALMAIRFHSHNNTARTFGALGQEFCRMASKHGIALAHCERIWMRINNVLVSCQKYLFFLYLDKIRK